MEVAWLALAEIPAKVRKTGGIKRKELNKILIPPLYLPHQILITTMHGRNNRYKERRKNERMVTNSSLNTIQIPNYSSGSRSGQQHGKIRSPTIHLRIWTGRLLRKQDVLR
jgi:hypothetical protein